MCRVLVTCAWAGLLMGGGCVQAPEAIDRGRVAVGDDAAGAPACELVTYERVREYERLMRLLPQGADVRGVWQVGVLTGIDYRVLSASTDDRDRAIIVDGEGRVVEGAQSDLAYCRQVGGDWLELKLRGERRFARVAGSGVEYAECAPGVSSVTFSPDSRVAMIDPRGMLTVGSMRDLRLVDCATKGIKPFHPMNAHAEAVWVGTSGLLAVTGAGDDASVIYDASLHEVGRFEGRVFTHCVLQGGVVPTIDKRGRVVLLTIDGEGRVRDSVRTGIDALFAFAPSPDGKRFLIVRDGSPRAWSVVRVEIAEDGKCTAREERISGRPVGWVAREE